MYKRTPRALIACCVALPLMTLAQSRTDGEEEGEPRPRAEREVKLPAFPSAANLLLFEASAASTNRFYVDAGSIYVGADGIVRFTLVIKTPGGAENVTHEGLRCDTREQKYYAIGRSDGTWATARAGEWRRIVYKEINPHHGVLYADYFCPDSRPVRSVAEAVQRFKYGVPRRDGSVR